ncbi:methyl-accepting chemotaxis protein I [Tatumella ptyseos ATCC 33301]|uniref:Methyl-accepting chemotaxis protein I n=2 Tax=Tatumella ptyseos TaxID=82987 RepID=A0A085JFD7_9GAMM|nr:methyl-accepting chemotaxis protein I [Tatumella ptyseos ATCC 33301]SQK75277.1 Dipeptide chemoreceptor protein [Tatumella ptyseos]
MASEVRNLAQRSSSAAREIKDLISLSVSQVEQGLEQATQVGGNTENVSSAIQQVADLVNEIATATAEQSAGIEQVHLAIGQMDEVTQQNASLVEQACTASRSLQEQAESLSGLVSSFTLEETVNYSAPADVLLLSPMRYCRQTADHLISGPGGNKAVAAE